MLAKNESGDVEFTITRHFKFPPELIFDAFTKPEHFNQWFGPTGSTVIKSSIDLRPGGLNHFGLKMSDGLALWGKYIYREITPPKRLVYVQSFSDEHGNITVHPLSPTWPREMLTIITFEKINDGTQLCIRWLPINATEEERSTFNAAESSMNQGWGGTLDKLVEYLSNNKF